MENTVAKNRQQLAASGKSLWARVMQQALNALEGGCLKLQLGSEQWTFGPLDTDLVAIIRIHDERFFRQVILGGSIGAGEAYIQGHWSSPDVTAVVRLFARNLPLLDKIEQRFSWFSNTVSRVKHLLRRNSKAGSKRNILAHYDLGNPLYQAFLDPELLYSSAVYPHEEAQLDEAQQYKLQLICERLDLQPGMSLLEIGTGWGALAIYAAKHYDVKVTTTTISDAQYQYASERVAAEGLSERITLLRQDYRQLSGQYDRLVSIEMIEAVGHDYLPGFFAGLDALLKPSGKLLLQAITIKDQRYDSYRKGVDFIQRYIFPGGCLPSVTEMTRHLQRQTSMTLWSLDDIGLDYARTLNDWHANFDDARERVRELGYGEDFVRMWKFYLSYCEGGFLERTISTVQLTAVKDGYRPLSSSQIAG
ncbi:MULTISPECIES: SAM-dependent methyltransferase [Shewanella]|uniref:Cyclopropane-fatty-acyl-phospholipid synthase family protein n=1 Tax=Shewanella indica TaxID=768528 RepID=A0ABU4Q8C8_9GAMM|nr:MULTISPECIES: cyclopropane-fatty-acyl-phospholipid synthase family protein [Shewanella]MDX6015048.1 cyclopropane-fatty-acyl-phospholipid synthase family protein [Shewanella indica]NDO74248.1 class I SAM-dependent methyltransferase [Shewanella sp. SE1]